MTTTRRRRGRRTPRSAPLLGALNVTWAPATGLPLESVTVTASGTAKSVPSCASWDVPAPAAMA